MPADWSTTGIQVEAYWGTRAEHPLQIASELRQFITQLSIADPQFGAMTGYPSRIKEVINEEVQFLTGEDEDKFKELADRFKEDEFFWLMSATSSLPLSLALMGQRHTLFFFGVHQARSD